MLVVKSFIANRVLLSIIILAISILISGCSWYLNLNSVNAALNDVELVLPDPGRVLKCVQKPGPACPLSRNDDLYSPLLIRDEERAIDTWRTSSSRNPDEIKEFNELIKASGPALAVLNDPIQSTINRVYNLSNGWSEPELAEAYGNARSDPGDGELVFTLSGYRDYAAKIERATSTGSWEALGALYVTASVHEASQFQASFLKEYFKAYFRYGKFIAVQIDASTVIEELKQKIRSELPALPQDKVDEISQALLDAAKLDDEGWSVGTISDIGFVSRGGQKYQFPGVQVTVTLPNPEPNLPNIDFTIVGADLVRVALNALFDSNEQVPGVSGSTGVEKGLLDDFTNVDPDLVNADEFAKIEQRSAQVEAATGAGVGKLIRGASFLSLNNEALATFIETALAVTARKQAEKVFWCYYACKQGQTFLNPAEVELIPFRTWKVGFVDVEEIGISGKAEF